MPLRPDITLPTDEELTVEEIPLTVNYMLPTAMWLGKYCDFQQKEYMQCRQEEKDPRVCLKYGRDLTACGVDFFKKVKKQCRDEVEWYAKCLDLCGTVPYYHHCRHPQALFDGCMSDSGFERARFGHFHMVRVHDSERPVPKPHIPVFDDAVPPFNMHDEEKVRKATPFGKYFLKFFT